MKNVIFVLGFVLSTPAFAAVKSTWDYPANASFDQIWNVYTARFNQYMYTKVKHFSGRHRGYTISNVEYYGGPWQRIKALRFVTGDGLDCTRKVLETKCLNGVADYDIAGMPNNPATGGAGY